MSLNFYRVVHLLGITMAMVSLGGLALNTLVQPGPLQPSHRRLVSITHGVGLLITIVAGIGLLHKSGYGDMSAWPGWVYLKFLIWLLVGGSLTLIKRVRSSAGMMWFLLPLIVMVGAYLALVKPF